MFAITFRERDGHITRLFVGERWRCVQLLDRFTLGEPESLISRYGMEAV